MKEKIICDKCLYKKLVTSCVVRMDKGVKRARHSGKCKLFNDGSKPNKARCG